MTEFFFGFLGVVSVAQSIWIIQLASVLGKHRRELDNLRAWAIGTEAGRTWRP